MRKAPRQKKPPTITELVSASLGGLVWDDVKRVFAALLCGCAAAAVGEYIITLVAAPGRLAVATVIRFFLLDLVLYGALYLVLAPIAALAAVLARLALAADDIERARRFRGLFAPADPAIRSPRTAPRLWAGALAIAVYLAGSSLLTLALSRSFKEPQLLAGLLAALQLGLVALCAIVAWVTDALLTRAAGPIGRRLGRRAWLNPLAHPTAAAAGLFLLGFPVAALLLLLVPQLGPLVPWRHLVSAGLIALGTHAATYLFARRGSLLPRGPRARLITLGALLFSSALVMPVTLVIIGADPASKSLAVSSSPPIRSLFDILRRSTDFDGDGYGTLLGENDCAPFHPARHPLARDLPDNGVDENCDGRDFQLGRVASYRKGKPMPVPPGFRQAWNVLLITVDTVRYDHTTMGGYAERTGRDTTPELAKLAARSVSFAFANAPSAGTMASIPAILTSKFFHSGIALDENVKKGSPPRLKDQNLLLSELFRAAGFRTGAILTHEWFGDWGMKQGFETYDNLVPRSDPFGTTSDRLTDAALAWIGQRSGDRWFLWLHAIDPHGRYVAHPGERSFGTSEEDLYDGELAYTDKHLGRLFDELGRLPGAEQTVIVVTSDHGDGFNEHGFINHGTALYREILHIPLIIHVPNAAPRLVAGAVSPLDILPTLVDLCSLDAKGADFEGESLVPQLFYGQDASERVVFAETNAQRTLRAAVTGRRKLIYDLKSNVYELFDLTADPWEKHNLWPMEDPAGFQEMKRYLDDWLERVYYARDATSNQAMTKIADTLLDAPPDPAVRVDQASLDGGAIQVLGFDGDKPSYAPGDRAELSVYFRAVRRPTTDLLFQVEAWREGGSAPAARSSMKATAGGLLPSSRWRDGEYIRDRIKLRLPDSWADPAGGSVLFGLRASEAAGRKPVPVSGPTKPGDPTLLLLGELRLDPAAPSPAKPAPTVPTPTRPALPAKPAPASQK